MGQKQVSSNEVMWRGQLFVNFPAVSIMALTIILLDEFVTMDYSGKVLISIVLGWVYWSYAIKNWIKWSLKNNVDRERLYKIGKYGLLIWNKENIDEVADNKRKPWF